MNLINRLIVSNRLQKIVNKNRLSRFFGWLSDARLPGFMLSYVIRKYIASYGINMAEYEFDIKTVKTFNEFFARKFVKGIRSFSEGIASPVEGSVAAYGKLQAGRLYQVKGNEYSLSCLTGQENDDFLKGSFATIYLSPANYHRVHAPFDMEIKELRYIPGTLLSTSMGTLEKEKDVYCRNERIILKGRSPEGSFIFVFVGAIVVGRIRLGFDDVVSNKRLKINIKELLPVVKVKKGEELGYFEMGSTVIVVLNNEKLTDLQRELNSPIMLGESIALF